MSKKVKTELENQIINLELLRPTDKEYMSTLKAIQILSGVDKGQQELEETIKRNKNQVKLQEKELELKEKSLKLEEKELEFKEKEFNNKRKEFEETAKNSKKESILRFAGLVIPVIISGAFSIAICKKYEKMAILSLNAEYCDNSITPRNFEEAKRNINNFVKR